MNIEGTKIHSFADMLYDYAANVKLSGRDYAELMLKGEYTNAQIRKAIKESVNDNGDMIFNTFSAKIAKPLIDSQCSRTMFKQNYVPTMSQNDKAMLTMWEMAHNSHPTV